MKLYLKSTTSFLTLALTLTASTAFSMDNAREIAFFQPSEIMHATPTRNPLFSAEEWMDIEIGHAILQDRIRQKQQTLSLLHEDTTSLETKMLYCQHDFGVVPYIGPLASRNNILAGIDAYSEYISIMLDTYRSVEQLLKLSINAETQEEKNHRQNNLYYFLSCEKKYFREAYMTFYNHQIPEHSLEDTFYEMISSKVCAKVTRKYDVLSKYIKITLTQEGIKKQIDDEKLHDYYRSIHRKLIQDFNHDHPIFWLHLVNDNIKNIVVPQVEIIENKLSECSDETIKIMNSLTANIKFYKEPTLDHATNLISLYNTFGPLILDTIKAYEAVSTKIKKIEKDSTVWLELFKETKKKLFRKIPQEQKRIISNYFQEQKRIELDRMREAERAAWAIQNQKAHQRNQRPSPKQTPVEKLSPTGKSFPTTNATSIKEELIQQSTATPSERTKGAVQLETMLETTTPVSSEAAGPSKVLPVPTLPEPIDQPKKLKIKTRPDPLNAPVVTEEKAKEESLPLTLPDQFKTPEFNYFIESLLGEKNDRKLIKLFRELNTVYGIFLETNEKNNKGYFSVRSPITNELHVRTYHHLHVDHPYASIFMAVRDVLVDAHLIER